MLLLFFSVQVSNPCQNACCLFTGELFFAFCTKVLEHFYFYIRYYKNTKQFSSEMKSDVCFIFLLDWEMCTETRAGQNQLPSLYILTHARMPERTFHGNSVRGDLCLKGQMSGKLKKIISAVI